MLAPPEHLTITGIIFAASYIGIGPADFIVGMVLAIVTIQGLHHPLASKLLGKIAKKMGRHTNFNLKEIILWLSEISIINLIIVKQQVDYHVDNANPDTRYYSSFNGLRTLFAQDRSERMLYLNAMSFGICWNNSTLYTNTLWCYNCYNILYCFDNKFKCHSILHWKS